MMMRTFLRHRSTLAKSRSRSLNAQRTLRPDDHVPRACAARGIFRLGRHSRRDAVDADPPVNCHVAPAQQHIHTPEKQCIRNLSHEGDDGVWHINYLRTDGEFDDHLSYLKLLSRHRDHMIALASSNCRLSSLSVKTNWLARCHNRVANDLPKDVLESFGFERSDSTIDLAGIPTLVSLPERGLDT